METYQELLLSENWTLKRDEVIIRDKKTCQNCNNISFEETFPKSHFKIILSNLTNIDSSTEISISNHRGANSRGIIPIGISLIASFFTERQKLYVLFDEENSNDKRFVNIYGLYYTPNDIDKNWIYIKGLHVHHKYYKKNTLPWDYPNTALTTLCWKCHSILHLNCLIPVFDEDDNLLEHYHVCERCFGAGFFPEFKHVKSGICFRCNGARYEELILEIKIP